MRDRVDRRLSRVAGRVAQTEGRIEQLEPPVDSLDLEDHPVRAGRRRHVDLDASGQLSPIRALRGAGLELLECDTECLKLSASGSSYLPGCS